MAIHSCPICDPPTTSQKIGACWHHFDCARCGTFEMDQTTIIDLPDTSRGWDEWTWRARLSHAVQRMQVDGGTPFLTSDILQRLYEQHDLPTISEQADNPSRWSFQGLAI